MPKGINRSKLRDRRLGALIRLEQTTPKNVKRENYRKREIENINFNLEWNGKECNRPKLKGRNKIKNV